MTSEDVDSDEIASDGLDREIEFDVKNEKVVAWNVVVKTSHITTHYDFGNKIVNVVNLTTASDVAYRPMTR